MWHFLREISKEEYEAALATGEERSVWEADDVGDMEEYLDDGEPYDYDELLDWACDHHEIDASKRQLRVVIRCYELCAARQMPVACLNLGTFYYEGRFVPQDFKKAAALYKIAADNGNEVAIRNLGYCYYYGRHQAVDFAKAFDCFMKAALFHEDANSLYKLGDMYREGQAVEKNPKYAYLLYTRALDSAKRHREYAYTKPDVYYRLGVCRLRGLGTETDAEAAHHLLQKALDGFYARRKTDPFVHGLIAKTKDCLREAQRQLDTEILRL